MKSSMSTTKKTLRIYLTESLHYKALFAATNISWMGGMLLQKLILPLIVAQSFDQIVKGQASGNLQWSLFTNKLILFVIIALLAQGMIDLGLVLLSKMETRVLKKLHMRVYDTLLNQSMHFHNNSFGGALVNQTNRFVNGYVAITDTVVISISQLIIFIFFSSLVLFFYSPIIALTLAVWSLFFLYINVALTKRRISISKARAAADSVLTGYLADSISNIGSIKTYSAEKHEHAKYDVLANDRAYKGYVYWIRSVKNDAVFGLLMGLLQVLILVVSIFAIQKGSISIGTLILAQVYITQIIAYLWGMSNITKTLEQNLSDAAEMTEILQKKSLVADHSHAVDLEIKKGLIEFDDVTFTHMENNESLFKNLAFAIKPGEKLGLVGPSGGGKTTITKLLLRFMDIQGGKIVIDGQDIADVTQASLRSTIAYVPQEPLLFHRTLSENIGYGKFGASQEEIESAAKKAHAHSFIGKLPNGYDTLVGERGVKLSGGQRQRIAIARAMLKNAPILVLDEATSALDSESEVLIQDALWKLMEGRTAIVIAHRLSTIQKMDRIIVLDDGKIVEQGTHQELIRKKGVYAGLWAHQSGGFLED
jgi:ATP-binding cassette subfamily B protein